MKATNCHTHLGTLIRALIVASLLFPIAASAAIYKLFDSPNAALPAQGPYGLRMDAITPPAGVGPAFSVEQGAASVLLTWNGGATATITGKLRNSEDNSIWDVMYTINNVIPKTGGFTSRTLSTMTLTDPSNASQDFFSEANDKGRHFRFLNLKATGEFVGNNQNKWLTTAQVIPLPPAVWLLATGCMALVCVARRRRTQG